MKVFCNHRWIAASDHSISVFKHLPAPHLLHHNNSFTAAQFVIQTECVFTHKSNQEPLLRSSHRTPTQWIGDTRPPNTNSGGGGVCAPRSESVSGETRRRRRPPGKISAEQSKDEKETGEESLSSETPADDHKSPQTLHTHTHTHTQNNTHPTCTHIKE